VSSRAAASSNHNNDCNTHCNNIGCDETIDDSSLDQSYKQNKENTTSSTTKRCRHVSDRIVLGENRNSERNAEKRFKNR
jgi:hypothetical protein